MYNLALYHFRRVFRCDNFIYANNTTAVDTFNGQSGGDSINFSNVTGGGITATSGINSTISVGGGNSDINVTGVSSLVATEQIDTVLANTGSASYSFLGGDDVITTLASNLSIDGGSGFDTLTYVNSGNVNLDFDSRSFGASRSFSNIEELYMGNGNNVVHSIGTNDTGLENLFLEGGNDRIDITALEIANHSGDPDAHNTFFDMGSGTDEIRIFSEGVINIATDQGGLLDDVDPNGNDIDIEALASLFSDVEILDITATSLGGANNTLRFDTLSSYDDFTGSSKDLIIQIDTNSGWDFDDISVALPGFSRDQNGIIGVQDEIWSDGSGRTITIDDIVT